MFTEQQQITPKTSTNPADGGKTLRVSGRTYERLRRFRAQVSGATLEPVESFDAAISTLLDNAEVQHGAAS